MRAASETHESQQSLALAPIGNCVLGALVDAKGSIVWCCYPTLDGDPIFCSLLNPSGACAGAGSFDIEIEHFAAARQHYSRNTAILVTTLTDRSGASVRITDFVPRYSHYGRTFRPSTLVRRIEPVAGSPRILIRLRPCTGYGSSEPTLSIGSNYLCYRASSMGLRLTTNAPLSYIREQIPFVLSEGVDLILGPDEPLTAPIPETARAFLERTEEYWLEWVRYLSVPFEWQDAVIRAAITLKLCSFEETGAIVAAMTTSIPEAPGTERNWDYRYCWLRDAYFVVYALNQLGATRTMEGFIRYITNAASLDEAALLKPVYGILPGIKFEERIAESLAGYRGQGPVRIGNDAERQVQNDVYGSVVLAATQMFFDRRLPRMGDRALFARLEQLGEWARRVALEPDASLWEFRGRAAVHTYSAAMCWAACHRLGEVATSLGLPARALYWREHAEHIRKAILEHAWQPARQSFVDQFGGRHVDASLLLLQEIGFVAADDPRFLGTLAAVERDLKRGDHLFRYEREDDFGAPGTAFTVCTFWYINALVAVGRRGEAREIFEKVLACRNHVGLLSEDISPETGELWGNFPQSYSMVGLVVSAMRLSRSWEEAFRYGGMSNVRPGA
ncbi:MAG TPA: glycoside hydrolase family 15 protein [Stellaceae bacterium]|nr:glycoside hydrolase family 15 protein [Stellaceae bacterium]